MSDEQPAGTDTDAGAAVSAAQDALTRFTARAAEVLGEDNTAAPAETPSRKTYGGDHEGLKEAGRAIRERREADPPPAHSAEAPTSEGQRAEHEAETKLSYIDGKDRSGGISHRDAAKDLADYHRRQAEAKAELAAQLAGEEAEQPEQQTTEQLEQPVEQPYDPDNQRQLAGQIEKENQRQQLREGWQQAASRTTEVESAMQNALASAAAIFPELTSGTAIERRAALERIRKDSPQRAAQFDSIDAHFRQLEGARGELLGYQQQLARYAASEIANDKATHIAREEAAAEKRVHELFPDLKDPAKEQAFKQAFGKHLADIGISSDEFKRLRANGQLNARALVTLAKAAKWEMAQNAAREVVAKPLPPVQRPGVSGNRNGAAHANQSGLFQQLHAADGKQRSTRIAAELIGMNRAARMRSR